MLKVMPPAVSGYQPFTSENGDFAFTRMDTGLELLEAAAEKRMLSPEKETALLLLTGDVRFRLEEREYHAARQDLFRENPYCLHIPAGTAVTITAARKSELLVISTTNPQRFPPVFYTPDMAKNRVLGDGVWNSAARRLIRDIFDYENAPYSNLVVGEIVNLPGRWSSYPPHWHRQPEVYYYRFDKPQGFGACFIGDQAYTVRHHSFAAIPGGLCHPQAAAPGYAMYYTWIIRHLENDPWNERNYDPAHDWLNSPDPEIFEL